MLNIIRNNAVWGSLKGNKRSTLVYSMRNSPSKHHVIRNVVWLKSPLSSSKQQASKQNKFISHLYFFAEFISLHPPIKGYIYKFS